MAAKRTPAQIAASLKSQIKEVDDGIIGETIGIAQAMSEIQKALTELDMALQNREYEQASQIGYESVTSNFVFLQRVLGCLQRACSDRELLVTEVARQAGCAYEEAMPHVHRMMVSAHPLKRRRKAISANRAAKVQGRKPERAPR